MVCGITGFFFFQAEDGIRDLVRSRGLGDVYKRQGMNGLEVARVASGKCHVVFVTAYNEHAVAAFEQLSLIHI